ncbi:hypothetical protein NZ47_10915 [Anaerovibrio lipolyticus]|uniref:Uncharacterized protein n=1 Tax=Anaerovibrio lipolyticus TaxID=82374 RepID=A0A0B2JXI5_9FIRM|nr:hypothetical protein [Anaerovibrio lipolyticus]KHM51356.1 hypothetical protein NZ47_10915 [Anaerovibrio lipolyticus]
MTACSDRNTGPIVGTGPHFGGWVCSQLSSDTIRAFHGIAGIRDVGMTGKDLGPMLLGYTLPSGAPHRVGVSDAGVWLTARMGGLTP